MAATEAGQRLLSVLSPALNDIGAALDVLDEGRDRVAGTVRLTMTRQAYDAVVRPILLPFLVAHPDAKLEVLIDYAYRDIIADRFDAGIRLGEKVERDMISMKVGADLRMAVVATPAYLAQGLPIHHPRDLTVHRCVNYRMSGSGALYAWEFERDGEPLSVPVQGPLAFNEPQLMLDDMGIGYLLDHEIADHVAASRLVRVLADWTPPFPGFHLYYSSRSQMRPVLAALLDMLRHSRRGASG